MLTDQTREEMLAKFPDYETKADYEWLNYLRFDLGFTLEDPRDDKDFDRSLTCDGDVYSGHFKLPLGYRYYCSIAVPEEIARLRLRAVAVEQREPIATDGEIAHAVAIDERRMVFDPSTNTPVIGTCTLEQYVRHKPRNAWSRPYSLPLPYYFEVTARVSTQSRKFRFRAR
jgi:hypothetical protein